jgi:GNAT superfamily N-acetyltransferase
MPKARRTSTRTAPARALTRRAARAGAKSRRVAPARAMTRSAAKWEFHALTPGRWKDLVALFGPRGACAGCWCMFPRMTGAEWKTQGASNRRAFERVVRAGDPPGLLAYEDGRPVGWVAVAPRDVYRRFERSRILQPVDEKPTWSVPCFFIDRPQRGRGLTVALLRAACIYASSRGADRIEGYPQDPAKPMPAAFAWHGLASAFRAAGFHEVARRSPTRPIMRRELGRGARSVARG